MQSIACQLLDKMGTSLKVSMEVKEDVEAQGGLPLDGSGEHITSKKNNRAADVRHLPTSTDQPSWKSN